MIRRFFFRIKNVTECCGPYGSMCISKKMTFSANLQDLCSKINVLYKYRTSKEADMVSRQCRSLLFRSPRSWDWIICVSKSKLWVGQPKICDKEY